MERSILVEYYRTVYRLRSEYRLINYKYTDTSVVQYSRISSPDLSLGGTLLLCFDICTYHIGLHFAGSITHDTVRYLGCVYHHPSALGELYTHTRDARAH